MMHSFSAAIFTEYRKLGKTMSMFELQISAWDFIRRHCSALLPTRNTNPPGS
jgi:hypothetical protein